MNIAVAVRLMPNMGDELDVAESGTDIDREIVEMVLNDFDDQALEEAVLLKEATGATVTAVGLRTEGIEQALQTAYARGADKVVVAEAGALEPYDSASAAAAFAEVFRRLAPDLVLVGVQTPCDVLGQTAPRLGSALGWPQASVVVKVEATDGAVRVFQEYAGGRLAILELSLPAVIGVQSASSSPRYVSMGRLRQAMSEASLETMSVNIERPPESPEFVSMFRPEAHTHATMLGGGTKEAAARILEVLRERGALMG